LSVVKEDDPPSTEVEEEDVEPVEVVLEVGDEEVQEAERESQRHRHGEGDLVSSLHAALLP
jgi:hypothetical protein